jgi:hypothetical protein
MDRIPITFEHDGKKYAGSFSSVHGAGQNVCYLIDDKNFYLGRLRVARDQWCFDATPKTEGLSKLENKSLTIIFVIPLCEAEEYQVW